MQISSRLTMAVHIIVCIETFKNEYKITSNFLASSVNVNPVIVRKLLSQLKNAGIIDVARGSGGTTLSKPLSDITLLDLYNAVECVEKGQLFHFHENPNVKCPVGRNIHNVLDDKLFNIQRKMEEEMKNVTMEMIVQDTQKLI